MKFINMIVSVIWETPPTNCGQGNILGLEVVYVDIETESLEAPHENEFR